jgi:hypothetical protein
MPEITQTAIDLRHLNGLLETERLRRAAFEAIGRDRSGR